MHQFMTTGDFLRKMQPLHTSSFGSDGSWPVLVANSFIMMIITLEIGNVHSPKALKSHRISLDDYLLLPGSSRSCMGVQF
jgi:hypothetical protein